MPSVKELNIVRITPDNQQISLLRISINQAGCKNISNHAVWTKDALSGKRLTGTKLPFKERIHWVTALVYIRTLTVSKHYIPKKLSQVLQQRERGTPALGKRPTKNTTFLQFPTRRTKNGKWIAERYFARLIPYRCLKLKGPIQATINQSRLNNNAQITGASGKMLSLRNWLKTLTVSRVVGWGRGPKNLKSLAVRFIKKSHRPDSAWHSWDKSHSEDCFWTTNQDGSSPSVLPRKA